MSSKRTLYGTTAFLSAFLLFVIEPMAAKQILPALGGSSAVWLTCLVFFQTTLLFGYLYAHWLTTTPRASTSGFQSRTHYGLLVLATCALALSVALGPINANSAHPVLTIFWMLTRSIALPFLVLASTSPLLQRWLSELEASPDGEPAPVWFRLFALSNTGSLLALLSYPTLIEPYLSLRHQRIGWTLGFLLFLLLSYRVAASARALAVPHAASQQNRAAFAAPASTKSRWLWFLLPLAAAMQLAAITAHLTINIAAIPLLWVLPLAVYLLTFILAFDKPALYQRPFVVRLLVLMLASLGYAITKDEFALPIGATVGFFLFECFVACLFCHGETYRLRPQRPSESTLFYLLIAAGGATGTFLVGIAFPLIFSANYDLALSFFATAVLALAATWSDGWPQRLLWTVASVLLFGLAIILHLSFRKQTLLSTRNFYGSLRVKQSDFHQQHVPMRTLMHGTIQHGTQIFSADGGHIPTSYYARDSGIGLALRFCCDSPPHPRNVGVIGLGTGTVAAYGQPGDRIRFYEINPQVEPISRNLFTYLRDSPAAITIVPGDARTSLTAELNASGPQRFDVLILDAFSGDAIPLHLLTREAMRLYVAHLKPTGILVVHVSNQYLNLAPEVEMLGESAHLEVRDVFSPSNDERGEFRAEWVLMASGSTFFYRPEISPFTDYIIPKPNLRLWTDDYSSLLPLIRLTGK